MTSTQLLIAQRVVAAYVQDALWHDSGRSVDVEMVVCDGEHELWKGTLTQDAAHRLAQRLPFVRGMHPNNPHVREMRWSISQ